MSDENPLIRLHASIALMKMDDQAGLKRASARWAATIPIGVVPAGEAKHFGVPLLTQLADQEGPKRRPAADD